MDPILLNLILLTPLFAGLLMSQIVRMPLRGLTGLYLLTVVANVLVWAFMLGEWLPPVIIGAVGLLVGVILAGFLFKKVAASDFVLFMAGVGLFPWTLWGFTASFIYAIVLVIFAVLIALRPKFKNPLKRNYK